MIIIMMIVIKWKVINSSINYYCLQIIELLTTCFKRVTREERGDRIRTSKGIGWLSKVETQPHLFNWLLRVMLMYTDCIPTFYWRGWWTLNFFLEVVGCSLEDKHGVDKTNHRSRFFMILLTCLTLIYHSQ